MSYVPESIPYSKEQHAKAMVLAKMKPSSITYDNLTWIVNNVLDCEGQFNIKDDYLKQDQFR